MRNYELVFAIKSSLKREEVNKLTNKLKEMIKSKGKLLSVEFWGRKKLAYRIKKEKEAVFGVMNFKVDKEFIKTLDNYLKLEENFIRYLIVRKEE